MNPNQNEEGFFITLASNLCREMYRENTNVDFINYLWKPIELKDEWYVGLVSIDYSDSFSFEGVSEDPRYPDQPKPRVETSSKPSLPGIPVPPSFLGNDNKITVDVVKENKFDFFKQDPETLLSFLLRLKTKLDQFVNQFVEFDTEYDGVAPEPTIIIKVKKSQTAKFSSS